MANVNAPFGLALVEDTSRTPLELCFIPSGDNVAVFIGDAVSTAGSSGNITGSPKKKTVKQAVANGAIYGVVQGFLKHWAFGTMDLSTRHRPASTDMYVLIKPANDQDIYRIQCDDVGHTIVDADVGLNADLVVGSGNAITGMSGMQLDSSTAQTTHNLQVKIIGYDDRPSNQPGVANQDVLVRINMSELGNDAGSAGV